MHKGDIKIILFKDNNIYSPLLCPLPAVVAFPAAPTPSPTLPYPSDSPYLPVESSFAPHTVPGAGVEDLPNAAGTAGLNLDSEAATETHDGQPEDELQQEQLPRQIHIQQHLKLHFHNQG